MARLKTYIIELTDEERTMLHKIFSNKKTCKTVLKRCQILLVLNEEHGTGLTHGRLAHSHAVYPVTTTNIIQAYVRNPIKDILRYNISPKSSAALRKMSGCTTHHKDCLWPCTKGTFPLDAPVLSDKSPH